MNQKEKRTRKVFFAADFILMITAFTFVHYNLENGNHALAYIQLLGGIVFLGLAILLYKKRETLQLVSWILVILYVGFVIAASYVADLNIINLIWIPLPYFLIMFLIGLKSGKIIGFVYFCGIITSIFVPFSTWDKEMLLIHRIDIIIANVFAFLFSIYYEKARTGNEEELLAKNKEIESLSNHDALTGLFNRRYLMVEIRKEFLRAKREKQSLALIIGDIDYFKNYNDLLGHLQGDACLTVVANAIRGSVTRPMDTVARYGGEEFAVLLPNTGRNGAKTVAERIQEKMLEKSLQHPSSDVSPTVTLSLGVALLQLEDDQNAEDLFHRADKAMYMSKTMGRNRITML